MNEHPLPDELARLEAKLEARPLLAPPALLRQQVLANARSARDADRRLLVATAAGVALFALALRASMPVDEDGGARRLEPDPHVRSDAAVLALLGFDSQESLRVAFVLAEARVPCIAPATGSMDLRMDLLPER